MMCMYASGTKTTGWYTPANRFNKGRWSKTEHELFLRGLGQFGKDWAVISGLLKTRSVLQIRTHAQKYFRSVERGLPFPENVS